MADAGVPFGIGRARRQDLTGHGHHVWWRRMALTMVGVLPALGLLSVFGQRAAPSSA